MIDDLSTNIIISESYKSLCKNYLNFESDNFVELIEKADLNPKYDLVGSDFSGVNFSNCDLRGYNFSECDLSNSFGENCKFDDTTIFSKANVAGSCFALEVQLRDLFKESPEFKKQLEKLRKGSWIEGSIWAGENRLSSSYGNFCLMGKALFLSTGDKFLRTQLLFYLRGAFTSNREYKEFILAALLRFSDEPRLIRVCLEILARVFINDTVARSVLLYYLNKKDYEYRIFVLGGILRSYSSYFSPEDLLESVIEFNSIELRRMYVDFVVKRNPNLDSTFIIDPRYKTYLDFDARITQSTLNEIARPMAQARNFARYGANQSGGHGANEHEIRMLAIRVKDEILKYKESGIPYSVV